MRWSTASHSGLRALGIAPSHAHGRYSRYIEAIDQLGRRPSPNPQLALDERGHALRAD